MHKDLYCAVDSYFAVILLNIFFALSIQHSQALYCNKKIPENEKKLLLTSMSKIIRNHPTAEIVHPGEFSDMPMAV